MIHPNNGHAQKPDIHVSIYMHGCTNAEFVPQASVWQTGFQGEMI